MKLTGPEILKRMDAGEIVIDPFSQGQLNPNSYNLRLDNKLVVYDRHPKVQRHPGSQHVERLDFRHVHQWAEDRLLARRNSAHITKVHPLARTPHIELGNWEDVIDMKAENPTYDLEIPETGLVLVPGRLYLAHTVEYTESHTVVPCIEGRSSVGRLGISIHSTAGFGDIGFCGTWTLEISVVEPVRVYPGVQFCQISYDTPEGEIVKYSSNKYQGQRTPRASGMWRELNEGNGSKGAGQAAEVVPGS